MIFIRDRGVLLKDENDVDLKTSMGLRFLMEEIRTVIYTSHYNSPIGRILLASRNENLIGLWIENQKYYFDCVKEKTKKKRMSYFEKQEWEVIEDEIAKLEEDIESIEAQMQENASDYGKLAELQRSLDEANENLLEKYERYEYLSDLAE